MKYVRETLTNLRLAARALSRRPFYSVVVISMLALAFGAIATIFAALDTVLISPLIYENPDQLIWLRERQAEIPARQISYPTFLDWQARNESLSAIAAARDMRVRWTDDGETQVIDAALVTADYFRVLGIEPTRGRNFLPTDDVFGAPNVTIVSYVFWQSELGGAPDVVGIPLKLDDTDYTIVGVLPSAPRPPSSADVWVLTGARAAPESQWMDRTVRTAGFAVARIKPDHTLDEARADLSRVQQQLSLEHPRGVAGHDIEIMSLKEMLIGEIRLPLLLSLSAIAILFTIVCVNFSNLSLVRAIGRRNEFAIRAALGADAPRVARVILAEITLLVASSLLLGLGFALWGTRVLEFLLVDQLTADTVITLDKGVVVSMAVIAAIVIVGTSIAPLGASVSSRFGRWLHEGGKSFGSPTKARTLAVFFVFQTTISVILLVAATLLATSMFNILAADTGFDKRGLLTFRLNLPSEYAGPANLNSLYEEVLRELQSVPGSSSVAISNTLPGLEPSWQTDIAPEVGGEYRAISPGEEINVDWHIISADYFEAMRIRLKRGRTLTDEESQTGASVMLIDESLANRFWPDDDAVGQHIKYDSPTPIEIVGIAGNVSIYGESAPGRVSIYTPLGRFPFLGGDMVVSMRADGFDPSALISTAQARIQSINPGIAVYDIATLNQRLDERLAVKTLTTWIIVLFAAFATLLTGMGLYCIVSYSVRQRTHELGLRIALGARRIDVAQYVLTKTMPLSLAGILLGVALSASGSHVLSSLLFGVNPHDAPVYVTVVVLFTMISALACAIPTWHAMHVDPTSSLRAL